MGSGNAKGNGKLPEIGDDVDVSHKPKRDLVGSAKNLFGKNDEPKGAKDGRGPIARSNSLGEALGESLGIFKPKPLSDRQASVINHAAKAQEQLDQSFVVVKTLGEGAFGMVTLLSHKGSGRLFAMKKMAKRGLIKIAGCEPESKEVQRERLALIQCKDCPFITTMYFAFQTVEDVFMVMDFAPGGTLDEYIDAHCREDSPLKKDKPPSSIVTLFLAEMFLALRHMHQIGYINRDIKPENMLIDLDGHLILCDLGLAIKYDTPGVAVIGTEYYLPPKGESASFMMDYWALGVSFAELMTGENPIYRTFASVAMGGNMSPQETQEFDRQNRLRVHGLRDSGFSDALINAVRSLLMKDPAARLGHDAPEANSFAEHRVFSKLDLEKVLKREYEGLHNPTKSKWKKVRRSASVMAIENASQEEVVTIGLEMNDEVEQSARGDLVMGVRREISVKEAMKHQQWKGEEGITRLMTFLKKPLSDAEQTMFRGWEYTADEVNMHGNIWANDGSFTSESLRAMSAFCRQVSRRQSHTGEIAGGSKLANLEGMMDTMGEEDEDEEDDKKSYKSPLGTTVEKLAEDEQRRGIARHPSLAFVDEATPPAADRSIDANPASATTSGAKDQQLPSASARSNRKSVLKATSTVADDDGGDGGGEGDTQMEDAQPTEGAPMAAEGVEKKTKRVRKEGA